MKEIYTLWKMVGNPVGKNHLVQIGDENGYDTLKDAEIALNLYATPDSPYLYIKDSKGEIV